MRREKRLSKRERKALQDPSTHTHDDRHIHCVACGRHIDPDEFSASPPLSLFIRCEHGSKFPSCTGCQVRSTELVAEHDRSGKPVATAAAWH